MPPKRFWELTTTAALLVAVGIAATGVLQYEHRQRQTRLLKAELDAEPPHADVLRRLLDRGADPHVQGSAGKNLLMVAARINAPDLVTRALQSGLAATIRDQYGDGALEYAINAARQEPEPVAVVQTLVDHGAELHGVTMSSGGPLFTAAYRGETEVVKILVTAGANIDQQDSQGYTPLFHAALGRQPLAVETLLTLGADQYLRARNGRTAAEEARLSCAARVKALRRVKAVPRELDQTERNCRAVFQLLR